METKSLHTIQVLAKIAKIISTIVLVCCIVGAIGCSIGLICAAAGLGTTILIGNVTIHGVIETAAEMSFGTMCAGMAASLVLCIGEIILSKKSINYFKNELTAGTPFTFEGAQELLKLGIAAIVIPIVTIIVATITYGIIAANIADTAKFDIDGYASVGLGVFFIILSVIFKYGAEISSEKKAQL